MKSVLALIICFVTLFGDAQYNIMTEESVPFNYTDENGELAGISVEIVRELLKIIGHKDNIKMMPWNRSYKMTQKLPGNILFPMVRLPEREKLFKWVGPFASNRWVVFANKDSNATVNSLEELKNGKYTIGTYQNDACELHLKKEGFENLDSVYDDNLNISKLKNGRIDLWATGEIDAYHKAKEAGVAIKPVIAIKNFDLYIAFSPDTPDSEIKKWQEALDELKRSDKYREIVDKYLKG